MSGDPDKNPEDHGRHSLVMRSGFGEDMYFKVVDGRVLFQLDIGSELLR